MHIAREPEVHRAVIAKDRAVDRHVATDRHVGIPVQHLMAHQIERELRPRHIGADEVERRDR